MAKAKKQATQAHVGISAPNMVIAEFVIRGTAPLVLNKFSQRIKDDIHATQAAGSVAKKGKKREPKDFEAMYEGATYKSPDGWCGIHAAAFRNAMISACRIVGFTMTRAKLSVFVLADGYDAEDGTPLVRITKGERRYFEAVARNDNGTIDLRARPRWEPGWEAKVRVRFDADQFALDDVANLMHRVGLQVGIGEGRADSKNSCGQGWGFFDLAGKPKPVKGAL